MRKTISLALLASAIAVAAVSAQAADPATAETVTPVLQRALAGIEGKEVVMVTVAYPPGTESMAHRHDANVFVYVLEGSVVMQVAGGKPVTLMVGQTFYESPIDVHAVSKNASNAQPAKILAVLVKDAGKPATMPVK